MDVLMFTLGLGGDRTQRETRLITLRTLIVCNPVALRGLVSREFSADMTVRAVVLPFCNVETEDIQAHHRKAFGLSVLTGAVIVRV